MKSLNSQHTATMLGTLVLLAGLLTGSAHAREIDADPARSVMWDRMVERYMPEGDVRFDDRVRILAPRSAENAMHVPITVDATALPDVEEVIAFADLNPIQLIMSFRPRMDDSEQGRSTRLQPWLGFALKLQQASPVHVAARTTSGDWHVAVVEVDAAGGGCTAPAAAHGTSNWMQTLGDTHTLAFRQNVDQARMVFRLRHPMDTGLADGVPEFYLSSLQVQGATGSTLGELDLYQPISENPVLYFQLGLADGGSRPLSVHGRDTEGNQYQFELVVPAADS